MKMATPAKVIRGSVTIVRGFAREIRYAIPVAKWQRLLALSFLLTLPLSTSASLHLGTLHGVVIGAKGERVAAAKVRIEGATIRETVSDFAGRFTFPYLPAASYVVSIDRDGYGSEVQNDVIVESARRTKLTIQLPEDPDEIVTLTEETNIADPTDLDPAANIDRRELKETPLPEDASELVSRFPGVVTGTLGLRSYDVFFSSSKGSPGLPRLFLNGVAISSSARRPIGGLLRESIEGVALVVSSSDPAFESSEGELHLVTPAATSGFSGSLYGAYSPKAFQSSSGPIGNHLEFGIDTAFEVGGTLVRDRLRGWAFLGTNRRDSRVHRDGTSARREHNVLTTAALGRLDASVSPSLHLTGLFLLSRVRRTRDDSSDGRKYIANLAERSVESLVSLDSNSIISSRATALFKFSSVEYAGAIGEGLEKPLQGSGDLFIDASSRSVAQSIRIRASYDRVSSYRQERSASYGVSASDLVEWKQWSVLAGVRVEYSSEVESPDGQSTVDPRITIARSLGKDERTHLKIGFNRYRNLQSDSVSEIVAIGERQILPEFITGLQWTRRRYDDVSCYQKVTGNIEGDIEYESAGVFARKRMSNRWMTRVFADVANQSHGCEAGSQGILNEAALTYGATVAVEGPWNLEIALVTNGRSAVKTESREVSRSIFQGDLRITRSFSIVEKNVDAFVEVTNLTNERDDQRSLAVIPPIPVVNNQLARSVRIGGRVNF